MNWNYTKFFWKSYYKNFFLWPAVTLVILFLPIDIDKETRVLLMCVPGLFNLMRAMTYDLIPKNTNFGKATSMKYLLSLNMTKKELYCNYILSSYILYFPALFMFIVIAFFMSESNPWLMSALATLAGFAFFFWVSNNNFYQKFFVHKSGTFQDQFLRGQTFYLTKIFVVSSVCFWAALLALDYFAPHLFKVVIASLGYVFLIIVEAVVKYHIYIPGLILFAFYKYRKSLKDFIDPHFFFRPFRDESKEKKIIFASIGLVLCSIFIDYPSEEFRGNKLTEAIYYQDAEAIQKYATSENINKPSLTGLTPILAAAAKGQWETYQFLKKKGADLSYKNGAYSLLGASLQGRNTKIVEDVIDLKIFDINKKNEQGHTPLHYASRHCRGELAKLLVKKGADINAQDDKGQTPLHFTVQYACNDLGLTLLSLGADPLIKDKENKVALDFKKKELLPYFEEQLRKPASIEHDD